MTDGDARHDELGPPEPSDHEPETAAPVSDEERIGVLIARLARPHRSGGRVIERASLLAAGADFSAAMAWIEAHGGEPELPAAPRAPRGLHGHRLTNGGAGGSGGATPPTPLRFILPSARTSEIRSTP